MSKTEYSKEIEIAFDFKDSVKALSQNLTKELKDSFQSGLDSFAKGIKKVYDGIISSFKTSLSDVIDELNNMLDFSKLSNANTRQLALQYGFSSSEAYGFDKAKSLLGFDSEEDLFYANTQELQQFREAFEKYSDYYTNLYDSGFFKQLQEYQYEMADFKQEMQMQVIEFFMDNKDTIKSGMQAIMDIAKLLMKMFGWMVDLFGNRLGLEGMSSTDIVNQYSNSSSRTNNTNVSVSNTFNNVAKNDETWLANAGSMTYQQVIKALGGN